MKKTAFIILLLTLIPVAYAQNISSNVTRAEKEVIVKTINPEELGISQVTLNNTIVSRVGTSYTVENKTLEKDMQRGLILLKNNYSKDFSSIINSLNRGEGVTYQKVSQVYEINSVYANVEKTTYRTKRTISVLTDESFQSLLIADFLDKKTASNISEVSFVDNPDSAGENPLSLFWNWNNVSANTQLKVSYFVHDIVVGDESNFIVAAGEVEKEGTGIKAPEQFQENNEGNRTFIERKIHNIGMTFSNNLLFFSVIAGVLIVVGIVLIELESRGKFEFLKNLCRDCVVIFRVGFRNRSIMQNYVDECLRDGHHIEDIRVSLMRAGWDRKAVRTLLRKYK